MVAGAGAGRHRNASNFVWRRLCAPHATTRVAMVNWTNLILVTSWVMLASFALFTLYAWYRRKRMREEEVEVLFELYNEELVYNTKLNANARHAAGDRTIPMYAPDMKFYSSAQAHGQSALLRLQALQGMNMHTPGANGYCSTLTQRSKSVRFAEHVEMGKVTRKHATLKTAI
ncbi:hypothetical protein FVE85_1442 [Porphyridium purpureum]|uniref:Uncharacterized protein n=1 Tax=Porphyridium purpureum TaxID=35688 RepID=A0A5J4YXU6_PORPP|nr:hypothetical protein FVE85_1442 [Porphyridium purpureum]|eukprot:POR2877..scf209_3